MDALTKKLREILKKANTNICLKDIEGFKTLDYGLTFKTDGVDEKTGIIEGHAAAFDNLDSVFDIIDGGAFKKTIQDGMHWPVLKDHMSSQKIGFNLFAKEDAKGLFIREQLNLETQFGKEAFSMAKMAHEIGARDPLSIGYTVIKEEPDSENESINHLKEVRMWEHSHVTFPANPEAFTTGVKDFNKTLGQYVDFFYRHMDTMGFNCKEVTEALRNGAALSKANEPELFHSIDQACSFFKRATEDLKAK